MKSIRSFALLSLAILAFALQARAQTNPITSGQWVQANMSESVAPIDQVTFVQTVTGFFTSFNTNLDCTFTNRGTLWAGVANNIGGGGSALQNELGFSYTVWGGAAPEVIIRNGGMSGSVDSLQGGLSYGYVVVDTRLAAYLDGGYSWDTKKAYGEIGARVSKALTTHTFAQVSYGVQITGTSGAPPQVLVASAGFTF
jgi:hypothetical protein